MSNFMTPAMFEIALGRGQILPIEAYQFADEMLLAQDINPLEAFRNPEIQRQHFVVARDFFVKTMDGVWPELPDGPVHINLPPAIIDVQFRPITEESTGTKER